MSALRFSLHGAQNKEKKDRLQQQARDMVSAVHLALELIQPHHQFVQIATPEDEGVES